MLKKWLGQTRAEEILNEYGIVLFLPPVSITLTWMFEMFITFLKTMQYDSVIFELGL